MKHLLSVHDLSNDELEGILARAQTIATEGNVASGAIVCTAFFEPSTRTRLSFEAAAHRLGADVIGFSDASATSSAKGESLEDSVRVLSGYCDVLVLRHPETGAAKRAAAVSSVPVINAGDGSGEHPTQTLLDVFTMRQALGALSGKSVALVGDLRHGRTIHSLVPVLERLGVSMVAVPAPGLGLPDELAGGIPEVSIEEAAASCDVLYATRVQKERIEGKASDAPVIDAALLERTKSKAIVMHPLPRVNEIAADVDALAAAKYFDQAKNGLPVRMAVLATLLENRS